MNTLLIYTNNNELKLQYIDAIEKHNKQSKGESEGECECECECESEEYNSGFDLFVPHKITSQEDEIELGFEIVGAMFDPDNKPMPYDLRPRSSLVKYKVIMSNSSGVIDNGYRGNLKTYLTNTWRLKINIDKYSRLVQICNPDLRFFKVKLVERLEDLGITKRGSGGFGSTGK